MRLTINISKFSFLFKISLETSKYDNPFIIFTNGQSLMIIDNLNDYVMLTEPRVIPFNLNTTEQSITGNYLLKFFMYYLT